MDEPFGALDPVTRDALGERVRALHDRLGLTTMMVTHDMAEALLLADRVLVMAAGRIVADETPAACWPAKAATMAQALVAVPRDQAQALATLSREVTTSMSGIWDCAAGSGRQAGRTCPAGAAAIALGIVVALPLAVWAQRSSPLSRGVALGFASLVQTIPALALLALFFPVLLSLRAVFGEGLPTLGFLPALLALSLYALLPILRNAVTARDNMEPGVLEAADGVGMDGVAEIAAGRSTAGRALM